MRSCKLTTLPLYNNMIEIKSLNLSENLIEIFDIRLPNLINLNLSKNKLTKITCDLTATKILDLNLAFNSLVDVDSVLSKSPNLRTLNLSHNKIKRLDFKGFEVENLDVSFNQLASINNLDSLILLQQLLLSQNKLEFKNQTFLFPFLDEVSLENAFIGFSKITIVSFKSFDSIIKDAYSISFEKIKNEFFDLKLFGDIYHSNQFIRVLQKNVQNTFKQYVYISPKLAQKALLMIKDNFFKINSFHRFRRSIDGFLEFRDRQENRFLVFKKIILLKVNQRRLIK